MKTRKQNIDLLAWKRKVRRMGGLLYYLGILPRLCFPVKGYFAILEGECRDKPAPAFGYQISLYMAPASSFRTASATASTSTARVRVPS